MCTTGTGLRPSPTLTGTSSSSRCTGRLAAASWPSSCCTGRLAARTRRACVSFSSSCLGPCASPTQHVKPCMCKADKEPGIYTHRLPGLHGICCLGLQGRQVLSYPARHVAAMHVQGRRRTRHLHPQAAWATCHLLSWPAGEASSILSCTTCRSHACARPTKNQASTPTGCLGYRSSAVLACRGGNFYPGTGKPEEVGAEGAQGLNINIPWPTKGLGDAEYQAAFELVSPALVCLYL